MPKALTKINAFLLHLLNAAHVKIIKSYFSDIPNLRAFKLFKPIYAGSKHNFSAAKFHELCDNIGPLCTVVKSEHDHIFGFYVQAPWK